MASLFVIRGNDSGVKFDLDEERVSLGREPTNFIQLHDDQVSRHHAEIVLEDKQYFLRDLSSSNGTFVNSQAIETRPLASGDQVQMGRTLMLFTDTDDESSELVDGKVDIVSQDAPGDPSRIVSSVSQTEGSRVLTEQPEPTEAPWLARIRGNLQVMYRTALAVSHTLDIDQLLERIMQLIFDWVQVDRGCIMLVDPQTEELQPKVHRSSKEGEDAEKITISRTILDYVMEHNEGVLTSNARQDERFQAGASIMQQGIREAMCVPMQGRYDVVGVIYIDTTTPPQEVARQGGASRFTEDHLKLMIAIAHQAALAVEDTRYYSAMVQAERLAAVGQTIAALSHHIKNILQGIKASSFLIDDGLKRHDENMIRRGWEFMERNQQRIADVVMDMLTFSKEREPDMQPGDLNQVVGDVVELMQSRAEEAGVELRWRPDSHLPELTFDAEGIHRAVLNLVTNAIDACHETDEALVKVSTQFHPTENQARILVEDNGAGIAEEDLGKIFTLFVSTKHSRGTGLGLPVTQKIVQEHGGRVRVESELETGSRFTIELPAPGESADSNVTLA